MEESKYCHSTKASNCITCGTDVHSVGQKWHCSVKTLVCETSSGLKKSNSLAALQNFSDNY